MNIHELVAAVKAHAEANYTKGWDVVVECWDTNEVMQELREAGAVTLGDAIQVLRERVDLWHRAAG